MPMTPMKTPATRAEFEHNMYLLRERFRQGKIHLAPTVPIEGLLRVRTLPNGRIDFLSIDESARLQANMMAQMEGEMSLPEADLVDVAE